jgi:general secretion pathway protein A
MYESFFGLQERPFDLTSDPRYLFLTPSHREALSSLEYGISANTGVTVLIGEAGTGKTTLIRALLEAVDSRRTKAVYLNNPTLTRTEFLEFLAREFQLSSNRRPSKTRLLYDLERVLLELRRENVTAALIIDEAQSLPHELLEEIRLLANIETNREKLVPIVLAGQPELRDRLNHTSLRQLKQRIGLRCQLRPLDLVETGAYITARISIAGGTARSIFTRDAIVAIHDHSQGIPRSISVICHNALINAFALSQRPIMSGVVREVCLDLDLHRPSVMTPVPPLPVPAAVTPEPTWRNASIDLFTGLVRSRRRYSFFSQS